MGAELIRLGEQFEHLGDTVEGAMPDARAAILFDWENWWAIEGSAIHNCHLKYYDQVLKYYRAFYEMGISVDIVCESTCMDKKYDLIAAPCFYMCSPEFSDKVKDYVSAGGTFITTFLSGITDRTDNVILGGYPGAFRDVLGLWVEEIDGMYPDMKNSIVLNDGSQYECGEICDLIRLESAKAIGVYGKDFYRDTPCVTVNAYGDGHAYYISTSPEHGCIRKLLSDICRSLSIPTYDLPENVEAAFRIKDGKKFTFLMNHNNETVHVNLDTPYHDIISGHRISGLVPMSPRQCMILEELAKAD